MGRLRRPRDDRRSAPEGKGGCHCRTDDAPAKAPARVFNYGRIEREGTFTMRTIFTALVAALLLTFGVATAVVAQDDTSTETDSDVSVTNDGDEESATAGDASAADTDEGETATAGDVTATDTDDDDDTSTPGDGGSGTTTTTTTTATNLPRTGVGSAGAANAGLLVALFGLAAVGLGAAAWRLRRI